MEKVKQFEKCKKCGGVLFPWERQSDTCGGCILASFHEEAIKKCQKN